MQYVTVSVPLTVEPTLGTKVKVPLVPDTKLTPGGSAYSLLLLVAEITGIPPLLVGMTVVPPAAVRV